MPTKGGGVEKRDLTPGSHLSAVARHTAASVEKSCSFEAYRSSQALLVPLGTALIIAAFAILHFGDLVSFDLGGNGRALGVPLDDAVRIVSKDLIDTNYAEEHVVSMLLFVIVLAAGVAVHRGANDQRSAFRAAHPYLRGSTDAEALAWGRRSGRRLVLAAAVLTLGGIVLHAATRSLGPADTPGTTALFDSQASPLYNITDGAVVLLFAVAVFLFMRGSRIAEAPSYLAYNLGALAERSVYSVDATEDGRLREVLLAAKGILDAGLLRGRVGLAVCIALSACLFFLPTLETALWWVPIIVGLVFRDAMVKVAVSRCKRELGPAMEELGVGRVS